MTWIWDYVFPHDETIEKPMISNLSQSFQLATGTTSGEEATGGLEGSAVVASPANDGQAGASGRGSPTGLGWDSGFPAMQDGRE